MPPLEHPTSSGERGSVLVWALIVIAFLGTLGGALAFVVSTDNAVAANYAAAQETVYGAEAGIERAIAALRLVPSWQAVTAGGAPVSSDFNDGSAFPRAADGAVLNLAQLTAERQAASDAFYPATANRPVWRLFGHASLDRMSGGSGSPSPYVVAWVADDPDEADGNPDADSNGVLLVHSEAFGFRGGRRAIEATLLQERALDAAAPGGVTRTDVRLIAWQEVR